MRRLIAAWCIALTVAAGFSGSAAADQVDDIMKRGTELRRVGRDAEALAEFQKALRLRDSPRATAQVAMAEQALGLWVEANLHLGQALEKETDPWIKKNRPTLEVARSTIQKHLCRVDFWGGPTGAEIAIDGKRVGTLPTAQVWVLPGEATFEAKADGFAAFHRTMKTPEGAIIREHVQLRPGQPAPPPPELAAAPVTPRPAAAAPLPVVAPASAEPVALVSKPADPAPPAGEGETHAWNKWWVWTLVGVGVIAVGGTTAWILTHRSESSCDRAPCTTWN